MDADPSSAGVPDDGILDVDTIVALSTAPGVAAIAVVRVSGPDAAAVLEAVAPDVSVRPLEPRVATLTRLCSPLDGASLDQALVTWFPGPDSYTGEDLVELSCHGGWLVPRLVVEACEAAGARQAEAGEFTRRAYLRGRLDLVQAEAVADVIHARSRSFHRQAVTQLERGLSDRITALRRALIGLEALLAHHVDFPEEDDPPTPLEHIAETAEDLVRSVDALLATAPEGELLREGALAVLAGRPNTGKSSLYNALLGDERAIVTEEAGTTRDALEASVELGGFPFRLVDTAGLRETDRRVERLGIEVTKRFLSGADVVLFCAEAGRPLGPDEIEFVEGLAGRTVVLVETKSDEGSDSRVAERGASRDRSGSHPSPGSPEWHAQVRVSAKTGEGLGRLRQTVARLVYAGLIDTAPEVPVITRQRHARALERARQEVSAFVDALSSGVPPELASGHLRAAESALEEVLGVITTDDVLDVVFRDFCVGK